MRSVLRLLAAAVVTAAALFAVPTWALAASSPTPAATLVDGDVYAAVSEPDGTTVKATASLPSADHSSVGAWLWSQVLSVDGSGHSGSVWSAGSSTGCTSLRLTQTEPGAETLLPYSPSDLWRTIMPAPSWLRHRKNRPEDTFDCMWLKCHGINSRLYRTDFSGEAGRDV